MVSLTDPISRSNCVDRWEDYVGNAATYNGTVVYGTNNKHFSEMPDDRYGGSSASLPSSDFSMDVDDIGSSGGIIDADTVKNATTSAATEWTIFRRMTGRRYYNNQGNYSLQTQVGPTNTYLPNSGQYDARISVPMPNVDATNGPRDGDILRPGQTTNISNPYYGQGLNGWYDDVRSELNTVLGSAGNYVTVDITICHYSCHYSCHSSRGRR